MQIILYLENEKKTRTFLKQREETFFSSIWKIPYS